MTSLPAPGPKPSDEYGADEISALVLDPGYSVTRAGFAGEDTPKSVMPTFYGYRENPSDNKARYVFDDNAVHNAYSALEIKNPMSSEGIVEDWDVASKLWEHAILSRLIGARDPDLKRDPGFYGEKNGENGENGNAEGEDGDVKMEDAEEAEKPMAESPLLLTEPGWNTAKNREKAIELAMEDWGVPAFWLGRAGVLAAFASGKPSALVIDIGASQLSVTPVWDGLILKKGTVKSHLGGNWISEQLRLIFSQSSPRVPLTPHYLVASKAQVDAGSPAQSTTRKYTVTPPESFRRLQEERVLTEFKESVVQVWNPALANNQSLSASAEYIKTLNGRPFEMPDGWNNVFGIDRFKSVEGLFDEKAAQTDASHPAPTSAQTLPGLVRAALNAVDVDARGALLNNVVVTGASSLINGFNDRIQHEIQAMYPGQKVKLHAPGNIVERKYASWIGGSILASLGSFHQMWISKKEYDETGRGIVEKRCK